MSRPSWVSWAMMSAREDIYSILGRATGSVNGGWSLRQCFVLWSIPLNPTLSRQGRGSFGHPLTSMGRMLWLKITGFPPRIKYGVTPCRARGRLFFRGNDGKGGGNDGWRWWVGEAEAETTPRRGRCPGNSAILNSYLPLASR